LKKISEYGTISHAHGLIGFNLTKKSIYRFNFITIKITQTLKLQFLTLYGKEKKTPPKKTRVIKTILNDKRTMGGIAFLHLRFYYRAIVIKTEWHWHKKDTLINGTELKT